jgi:hypothetical protein
LINFDFFCSAKDMLTVVAWVLNETNKVSRRGFAAHERKLKETVYSTAIKDLVKSLQADRTEGAVPG